MVKVSRIDQRSIAEELGIQSGTELLTVNGRPLADFLDWEFLTADEELVIEARQPDGEQVIYELERLDGERRQVAQVALGEARADVDSAGACRCRGTRGARGAPRPASCGRRSRCAPTGSASPTSRWSTFL